MTNVILQCDTVFDGTRLYEGEEIEVDEQTAARWAANKIAAIVAPPDPPTPPDPPDEIKKGGEK